MPRIIPALVSAALLLGSAGAAAADVRIAWGDLDLSTAAGASTLDRRIDRAADRACRNARRPASRIPDRAFCEARVRETVMDALPDAARQDYARSRRVITL